MAFSVDAPSSTAVQREGPASVPAWVDPEVQEDPAHVAPCIRRAALLVEHLQERAPALDSAPAWVHAPALASGPVRAERQALCRLQARHRARSVPAPMRAVAASNTRRPRKAR